MKKFVLIAGLIAGAVLLGVGSGCRRSSSKQPEQRQEGHSAVTSITSASGYKESGRGETEARQEVGARQLALPGTPAEKGTGPAKTVPATPSIAQPKAGQGSTAVKIPMAPEDK